MSKTLEDLSHINEIIAHFNQFATDCSDSATTLSDRDLESLVGDSALEAAVLAHGIVNKLRDAAGKIEVLAYALNRRVATFPPSVAARMRAVAPVPNHLESRITEGFDPDLP